MNKDIIDEIEFPDDIISFLKIKYPKAYTDQEKSAVKQLESLAEEKRELKELLNKKRDQEKTKLMPINVAACDEAKEKAIKLVQEGALNLTSRTKSLDFDDSLFGDADNANTESITKSKTRTNVEKQKGEKNSQSISGASQKISFVSAGYAFKDGPSEKVDESPESGLKRQISSSPSNDGGSSKRIRHISNSSSESDDLDSKIRGVNDRASENLRFCGHNLSVEFVRKIVEPLGTIVFIEIETRNDGLTPNVVLTMEDIDMAIAVKRGLDSKFIEGRVVTVHYKKDSSFPTRRPYRRRRYRDQLRSRDRFSFPKSSSFQSADAEKTLPSHFYSANIDVDGDDKRRPRYSGHDESEQNESVVKVVPSADSPNLEPDRGLVVYDGFPDEEDAMS